MQITYAAIAWRKGLSLLLLILAASALIGEVAAQACTLTAPQLFGLSRTGIYCKGNTVQIGVFYSELDQDYSFVINKANGGGKKKKGGPLDGSGGQLSVSTTLASAAEAGEYIVETFKEGCTDTSRSSFQVFYGDIDNLSVSAWGSNSVTFRWAASGPLPAVVYEYAVTTEPNPDFVSFNTTTDTVVTQLGLTSGNTYYIHVRVKEAYWGGDPFPVENYFPCSFILPTSTISFVACSGSPTIGTLSPYYPVVCTGSISVLSATGGTSYKWYKDNVEIPGATSSTYNVTQPGIYETYITTAAGCQGRVYSRSVMESSLSAGILIGGGSYFEGDTVKLGIENSKSEQDYIIKRDGIQVAVLTGVGKSNERNDIMYYSFVMDPSRAGEYTVTTTNPYCIAIDFGAEAVNLATGVSICPGSSTSFTIPSAGTGYTYQWQVNTGGGFVNINNSPPYSGVTTKTLSLTAVPDTYYGYIYRCVATNGGSTIYSSTRTLKFSVTWTGISSSWTSTLNWNCGSIPTANTDVIVPSGTLFTPIITSNVSCRSVDVKPGGNLRVNTGFKLTITGQQ